MEFWNLYRIIRKRLWMVLFLVAVTVSSTVYTVMSRPPSYSAMASVRVAITSPTVADVGRLDYYTGAILFSTVQETIVSRTILQEVIDQDKLGITPDDLRRAIVVSRIGASNMLSIQVKSTDPQMAKKLANDIAAIFIQYNQKLLDTQSAASISYYEEQAKLAEQNYSNAKDNFQASLNGPNERAAENQFIAAQSAYQSSVDKLDAARLINRFPDLRPASVAISEPAVTPAVPEGRQLTRYITIALLVSLLLGVFIALALEYLDLSIKSPHEVTSELGLGVLGVVPHFRRGISGFANVLANLDLPVISPLMRWRIRWLESKIMPREKLPVDSIEAFRKARVSLLASHRRRLTDGRGPCSMILITSSRPRDGKTTVTAHLGISLSKAGYRVLLVDADFRHPDLYRHFSLTADEPGLAQVLQGEANLKEAIRDTGYPNLFVILSGASRASEPDALDSDEFSGLLARLRQQYDFVLVDSPALGVVTDGAMLASRLGRAVLVIDAGHPSSENEFRSLALLTRAGADVEGVIINKINPDRVNPAKLHSLPRYVAEATDGTNGYGRMTATNGRSSTTSKIGPGAQLN